MEIQKVGTFKGVVIYHYDFENKDKKSVKTTKVLFNINGTAVYINSKEANEQKIGAVVLYDLGYNGSKWVII